MIDYACDGRTYSLTSEAIYENRLRPFTLTAGANYQYKYVDNEYSGSIATINRLRFSNLYGFLQMAGHLFGSLNYVAGVGLTYTYSHQDSHQYHYTLVRPKLILQYPLGRGWKLRYSAEIGQHVSQIANTSSVMVRTNSMEMEQGNPDLRPNGLIEQILRLSLDRQRFSSKIEAFYRRNNNVNLDKYIRTDHNLFIHSQKNQEQCTMFLLNAYANWFVVPEKFSVGASGGVSRFINVDDDYRHHYTSGQIQAWANAYLDKFSLSAYADNGWHFMEGEREAHNGSNISLSASYHLDDFDFSLTWQQPFESNHKSNYRYIRNRYVKKYFYQHDGDTSNLLYIGITWNLSRGKQYKGVTKQLNNSDRETGIMKM